MHAAALALDWARLYLFLGAGLVPALFFAVVLLVPGIDLERARANAEFWSSMVVMVWVWALSPLLLGAAIAIDVLRVRADRRTVTIGPDALRVGNAVVPWGSFTQARLQTVLGRRCLRLSAGWPHHATLVVPRDVDDAELASLLSEVQPALKRSGRRT